MEPKHFCVDVVANFIHKVLPTTFQPPVGARLASENCLHKHLSFELNQLVAVES